MESNITEEKKKDVINRSVDENGEPLKSWTC